MRSPLLQRAPVVLSLLILGSGHYAAGLHLNTTSGKGERSSEHPSSVGLETSSGGEMLLGSQISSVSEMPSVRELSTMTDYDYSEEYDDEPQISGYILDDAVRVEQVIKPKRNKTDSEKTSSKSNRKKKGGKNGKNRRNKKKKNPCDTKYRDFCIHGDCKYLDNMDRVSCKCFHDFFGERCGERIMKTQSMMDSNLSKLTLATIIVFVSVISLTAIVVITVQFWKRHFRAYEGEAEERKKLRQDSGNTPVVA